MPDFPVRRLVLFVVLGAWSNAMACSAQSPLAGDDLVRSADTILLATVVSGTAETFERSTWDSRELIQYWDKLGPGPQVTFNTIEVIKGRAPGPTFKLVGSLKYFGANLEAPPCLAVRPGGQRGMCFAYDYRLGGTFLLMLKGGSPYWAEVRPTNEEVVGAQDEWVLWVRASTRKASDAQ
jgi:hypothetical protein